MNPLSDTQWNVPRLHRNGACPPRLAAVSLIEILVVISVIALLLALLLPSLESARERARRMICVGNLRQWGVALQFYRDDYDDRLPQEGTHGSTAILRDGTWYNELPIYLDVPRYKDIEGVNEAIKVFPNMHVWICPSKNLTDAFKSGSGKNQFHYGMNQVLDGMGTGADDSDTPGFADQEMTHLPGMLFLKKPNTVFMFDIAPNSPRGSPRDVATEHQRNYEGGRMGKFHGDYANILYLSGGVTQCNTADLVSDRDFRHGEINWRSPRLDWGYRPPAP